MILTTNPTRSTMNKNSGKSLNPSRKILFSLIPNPAEEDDNNYPLPPCVGYVDLTGV